MENRLFSNLIDVIEKITSSRKALKDITKNEHVRHREVMEKTYRLINSTLNLVIIRLGDILLPENSDTFAAEVSRLDSYDDWIKAEREFRLCKSLRVALRETQSLTNRITGYLSTQDWDALLSQMKSVLAAE
jgi:hypothetical protein